MVLNHFFAQHPVFRLEELNQYMQEWRTNNNSNVSPVRRQEMLAYHLEKGHIIHLRQGLYASVPPGYTAEKYAVDSFLVASRFTPDAVLAYHTALSFLGIAHSIRNEFTVLSQIQARSFRYGGTLYRTTLPPTALPDKDKMTIGVETRQRLGLELRVTSWERTLVDTLDRLSLVGGWAEAWRSLSNIDVYLDIDFIVEYALLLNEAAICAKVGYYLQEHQTRFSVRRKHLDRLISHRPQQPHHVQRDRTVTTRRDTHRRLIPEWNLWIPVEQPETGQEIERFSFEEIEV